MKNTFPSSPISRREACRRALLFSAAFTTFGLPRMLQAVSPTVPVAGDTLNLFCFGDWGTGASSDQRAVAAALKKYAGTLRLTPDAFLLLGDNFYGSLPGIDSPRWKKEFEDMYPASVFPGPCHAILGNHDYDDQPGGEQIQMDYAHTPGTRWKMPSRWYRLDFPHATILCMDTHYNKLSPEDIATQQAWLEKQLSAPRTTPWLFVCGHHPVMSCGTNHGDSVHLASWRELFYRHGVHAYLSGHEHDLQHLHEEGNPTHWLISGGAGKGLHPVEPNQKTQFANACFGFLHLAVSPGKMDATFINTEAKEIYRLSKNAG